MFWWYEVESKYSVSQHGYWATFVECAAGSEWLSRLFLLVHFGLMQQVFEFEHTVHCQKPAGWCAKMQVCPWEFLKDWFSAFACGTQCSKGQQLLTLAGKLLRCLDRRLTQNAPSSIGIMISTMGTQNLVICSGKEVQNWPEMQQWCPSAAGRSTGTGMWPSIICQTPWASLIGVYSASCTRTWRCPSTPANWYPMCSTPTKGNRDWISAGTSFVSMQADQSTWTNWSHVRNLTPMSGTPCPSWRAGNGSPMTSTTHRCLRESSQQRSWCSFHFLIRKECCIMSSFMTWLSMELSSTKCSNACMFQSISGEVQQPGFNIIPSNCIWTTPLCTAVMLSKDVCRTCPSVYSNTPPYSPDLSLCDFFLFPILKKIMQGIEFWTINNIM